MGGMTAGAAAWMLIWGLLGLALLVGLAVGAALLVRGQAHRDQPPEVGGRAEADTALDTVRERYARGDIDEAELDRRLDRLIRTGREDRC